VTLHCGSVLGSWWGTKCHNLSHIAVGVPLGSHISCITSFLLDKELFFDGLYMGPPWKHDMLCSQFCASFVDDVSKDAPCFCVSWFIVKRFLRVHGLLQIVRMRPDTIDTIDVGHVDQIRQLDY
jgi:hypothetical protein